MKDTYLFILLVKLLILVSYNMGGENIFVFSCIVVANVVLSYIITTCTISVLKASADSVSLGRCPK